MNGEASGEPTAWRIDDLARKSGVTVDTLRYYQREGLLPEPVREGRSALYGPVHLFRLEQIRRLQEKRFSLAAIAALLAAEQSALVESLFDDHESPEYSADDLVERTGVDRALIDALRAGHLLSDPAEHGRDGYDASDLDMLLSMGALEQAGLPRRVVHAVAALYARNLERLQSELVDLFTIDDPTVWEPGEQAVVQVAFGANIDDALVQIKNILNYLHQRTIQRTAVEATIRVAGGDQAKGSAKGSAAGALTAAGSGSPKAP